VGEYRHLAVAFEQRVFANDPGAQRGPDPQTAHVQALLAEGVPDGDAVEVGGGAGAGGQDRAGAVVFEEPAGHHRPGALQDRQAGLGDVLEDLGAAQCVGHRQILGLKLRAGAAYGDPRVEVLGDQRAGQGHLRSGVDLQAPAEDVADLFGQRAGHRDVGQVGGGLRAQDVDAHRAVARETPPG